MISGTVYKSRNILVWLWCVNYSRHATTLQETVGHLWAETCIKWCLESYILTSWKLNQINIPDSNMKNCHKLQKLSERDNIYNLNTIRLKYFFKQEVLLSARKHGCNKVVLSRQMAWDNDISETHHMNNACWRNRQDDIWMYVYLMTPSLRFPMVLFSHIALFSKGSMNKMAQLQPNIVSAILLSAAGIRL